MGYTRLSVLLAHLILCFTFAESAISFTNGEPSTAKRFGFRSSEPLTRRSPDTHFMRFGRSGGGDGNGDNGGNGGNSGNGGNGGIASKKNVKREAYGLAAVDASVSPAPSLTCVPDADTDGRVVCYSPVNVSRHFLLVTDHDGDPQDDDGVEDEQREEDDDEERSDNDSERSLGDVVDDGTADEGRVDRADNGARNRTAPRSRRRGSGKRRFGRSTAADVRGADAFARYGRRRDNFMRLGRAGVNQNESPLSELGGGANSEADYAAVSRGDKRGSQSFIRFGRERSQMARQSLTGGRIRDARQRPSTDKDESADGDGDPSARQRDAFARLGRHGPGDMNQLRFGRGSSDRIGARVARRHGNFMRLGRSGGDFDLDMFRETRRRDSFLRLGRGGGRGPVVDGGGISGISGISGSSGGGGGGDNDENDEDEDNDDDDDEDIYRIAMATAALNSRIKA